MPSLRDDRYAAAVSNPLSFIQRLFDQANQPIHDDSNDWGVAELYGRLLQDPCLRDQIPILTPETLDQIPNESLCRYQGMVQDMLDPEYYVGAFRQPDGLWSTRKYSDASAEGASAEADTVIWARKPLYCCRVPGASDWCSSSKRQQQAADLTHQSGKQLKREREGDDAQVKQELSTSNPQEKSARARIEPSAPQSDQAHASAASPPSAEGDCIVFTYDKEEGLRLNEVVEIVGIKSVVPELAAHQMSPQDTNMDFIEEELAARPPTSLVPRIHALAAIRVESPQDLPIITYKGSEERQAQVAELRKAALRYLQAVLYGDELAAEYVLLQLVSRTYSRTDTAALGLLSLGLTACPAGSGEQSAAPLGSSLALSEFAQAFQRGLSALAPRCVGLPVSIEKLNKSTWRPARDSATNRLTQSPLQLPENTHLVLDETLLQAGQLTALGVRNFETLKGLLDHKKVDYDFHFYTLPVNTDVAVTILSERKSLLNASLDATLPLRFSTQSVGAADVDRLAEGEEMNSVRAYLSLVRQLEFTITQPVSSLLENELVEARKRDKHLDPSTMHTWLTIARLLALSHGCDTLEAKHWQEMQNLEFKRAQRIRAYD